MQQVYSNDFPVLTQLFIIHIKYICCRRYNTVNKIIEHKKIILGLHKTDRCVYTMIIILETNQSNNRFGLLYSTV